MKYSINPNRDSMKFIVSLHPTLIQAVSRRLFRKKFLPAIFLFSWMRLIFFSSFGSCFRNVPYKGVGRKIPRVSQRKKTRPKNSTIKLPSTLSVSCMKIQWGSTLSCPHLPTLVVPYIIYLIFKNVLLPQRGVQRATASTWGATCYYLNVGCGPHPLSNCKPTIRLMMGWGPHHQRWEPHHQIVERPGGCWCNNCRKLFVRHVSSVLQRRWASLTMNFPSHAATERPSFIVLLYLLRRINHKRILFAAHRPAAIVCRIFLTFSLTDLVQIPRPIITPTSSHQQNIHSNGLTQGVFSWPHSQIGGIPFVPINLSTASEYPVLLLFTFDQFPLFRVNKTTFRSIYR